MSEPLKPRIDFDGPLQAEKIPPLKGARAFDTLEADNFAPARLVRPTSRHVATLPCVRPYS